MSTARRLATTRNPHVNPEGPSYRGKTVWRYVIGAPGGYDVNKTFGSETDTREEEIAFLGGIRPQNILGAEVVLNRPAYIEDPDGNIELTIPEVGSLQRNPRYDPNNDHAPHAPDASGSMSATGLDASGKEPGASQ